ncbi:MAG: response regulator [bacterium]|nr:response regulator [bacterium]
MSKPNVLVIAQHAETQEEFKNILAGDYEHLTASNGVDGVAISRMARPAVIFVDANITKPEAAGVCKSLLSHETVKSIPVVALADTASVNGELSSLANFKGVLQRPIQADQVKTKIQTVVGDDTGAETGVKKPTTARDEPIRVLSVDDSSVVRKLVTMILTAEGFKVTTASDGLDGINKAKEIKPDIILLDFVMPKMNGFQVCRILQKDDKLRQIPVILVTSKGDKVGDKFVDQLGVTGYITKPFQPEELVSKIHQTLDTPQEEDVVPEAAPQAAPAAPATAAQTPAAPAAPQAAAPRAAAQPGEDAIRKIVLKELEKKVKEMVAKELESFSATLDKRIEKRVIEKMNEYIRRAKKK